MNQDFDADRALIAAFWRTVAAHGWNGASMGRFAAEAGQDAAALGERFADRLGLLRLHLSVVDRLVEANISADPSETTHDRLHDALMCRVEALQPHRAGILAFAEALRRDPLMALALAPDMMRSMRHMLATARLDTSGTLASLHTKAMAAIWLMVFNAWRDDDGADLGHTMAEADKAIQRAADWGRRFGVLPHDA